MNDTSPPTKKRKTKRGEAWGFAIAAALEFGRDEAEEECIIWPYSKSPIIKGGGPYGKVRHEGKIWRVHRLTLTLAVGPAPDSKLLACHGSCNNPLCCNPHHLYWADGKKNMMDRNRDGTMNPPKGEKHSQAKLKEEQVRDIRARYAAGGITQRELAKRYKVSQSLINAILNHQLWGHLV